MKLHVSTDCRRNNTKKPSLVGVFESIELSCQDLSETPSLLPCLWKKRFEDRTSEG